MKLLGFLAAASALVAIPAKGVEPLGIFSTLDSGDLRTAISSFAPLLTPSPAMLEFSKRFLQSMENFVDAFGTPEQASQMKKFNVLLLQKEEQLLLLYTRMQDIKHEIDFGVKPAYEEALRNEMQQLLKSYNEVVEQRKSESMQVVSGLVPPELLNNQLQSPMMLEVKKIIEDIVLSEFQKYT